MKYAIEVDGMHCAHCAQAVENALRNLGAMEISINTITGIALITSAEALTEAAVSAAIDDVGFDFLSMKAV